MYDSTQLALASSSDVTSLEPTLNPNPHASVGGADIKIEDSSSLVPAAGPSISKNAPDYHPVNGHISTYVVRSGDTLSQIAQMFGVSTNTIVWGNDIKGGSITPGQTLVILPVSGIQHAVVKGETLATIVKKYGGNNQEVIDFNNLTSTSKITIGDTIIIPDGELAAPPTSKGSTKQSSSRSAASALTEPIHSVYISPSINSTAYYSAPLGHYIETQGLHGFNGVDLAAPIGTPIMAAAAGKVIVSKTSGWNGGYGTYVVISHPNGTQTLYAHMSKNNTSMGQVVSQGEPIGAVGSTGKSTGAHLHFEVRGAKNPF